jgi:porin
MRPLQILSTIALVALLATRAYAQESEPTGVPEDSIAAGWNDPVRASFARAGINYGASYTGEYFDVASGGLSRGSSYNGLVDAYVDVDLDRLLGWKGAAVHANVYYLHGEGPTAKHVGNLFAVSNLEGLETFRLDELWFEQALLEDKLKVRLGALAADTEFFISDTAGAFLNGTFGWAGIVAADMVQGGPAYPLTSMGARLQFDPTENVSILAAIYNGSPANPFAADPQADNRHGVDFRFGDSALMIVEGQFRYDIGLPGTVKLGGWRQFNDNVYTDFLTGAPVDGSHGLYAVVDQQIWKNGSDQSVSVFTRVSGSPTRQNLIDYYVDTGILFTGFVPSRPNDAFGAAFGYGHISNRYAASEIAAMQPVISDYEAALEINYTTELAPGITVIPDFQYIWNPGGRVEDPNRPGQPIPDAAVFGVRTRVSY